ncbi:hypothetical protein MTO96_047416 [Rhipicephalus appendiculatus]
MTSSRWFPDPDHRSEGWFLTGSAAPLMALLAVYVYTVKPYNLFMVLNCAFFLAEFVRLAFIENGYSLLLQEVDSSLRPATMRLVSLSWWYYMFRIFEFTETIFFVLRKKFGQGTKIPALIKPTEDQLTAFCADSVYPAAAIRRGASVEVNATCVQVSGLHVVHHCVIAWNMWICVTYGAQAQTIFVTCMNTLVHLVMYSYYFLAALGPRAQRFLWWKRYLTQCP